MVNDSINDIAVFLHLVGRRVAATRQLRHLSQPQLAERSGLPAEVLAALEAGDSGVEVDDLQRVADVLGTSITELLPSEAEVRAAGELRAAARSAGGGRGAGGGRSAGGGQGAGGGEAAGPWEPPSRRDPAGGRPAGS